MTRNLILIAFLISAITGVFWLGDRHGTQRTQLIYSKATVKAVQEARETEQQRQKVTNDAIQQQADDLGSIAANLALDLERLRNRPERVRTAIHPGAECKGTTGAELSRQDAEFLTREASRADTLRAALIACYAYADGLQ